MASLCGLLNIDKPPAITSRRVVDRIERLVRPAKVGHAGTLDPLATGVLVVAVGAATRLIEYVQRSPKQYRATFLLGRQSPTDDVEGEVRLLPDAPVPDRQQIAEAAARFLGTIEQVPPSFSALKVAGRRAYELAREGRPAALKPRAVQIYRLELLAYDYPQLELQIECSQGTYVRSLGRDLAASLGTAAVMSALRRTAVGTFRESDATALHDLDKDNVEKHLLPPILALSALPQVRLSASQTAAVRNGQTIPRPRDGPQAEEYAALDPAGQLVGVLRVRGPARLGPVCNLPEPQARSM